MSYEFRGPGVQTAPSRQPRKERKVRQTQISAKRSSMAVVQILAGVVGAVFLLVGILGFIPGATTNFGDFGLIGPEPAAKLLGLFTVSVVHNIVHLAFGVAGLLTFRRAAAAGSFLIVGGLLYGVVLVYGLVVDRASSLNFLPINTADNWLHLGLSTGMVLLGVVGTALLRRSPARA